MQGGKCRANASPLHQQLWYAILLAKVGIFLCTEDIAKLKLRTIYSKDIFELKLYHRPDKPRIPFEDMDCKLTFTVFDTNAKTIPDQNIRQMYKSKQKRNNPDPLA